MVHTESSEGKKYKPRGRPFPKGNKRGKLENGVLADSRHDSSNEGGVVSLTPEIGNTAPLNDESGITFQLPALAMDTLKPLLKEAMETPAEPKEDKEGDVKTIETMDFKNGDNTLSIRFSAVNNRRYRIQVFLNDDTEVRPVTYQGSSSGYAFWKLLKGALKK